jgi:hypothetical protein
MFVTEFGLVPLIRNPDLEGFVITQLPASQAPAFGLALGGLEVGHSGRLKVSRTTHERKEWQGQSIASRVAILKN